MSLPEPPTGRFEGPIHLFAVRAYFEDTDLSGVVYHANYLRWFERARSDMLRLLGIEQRPVYEAGEGAYAVSELGIRYAAPARLDDAVLIRSSTTQVQRASCRLQQSAWREGQLLADARLRIAFVAPGGRPRRQPEAWLAAIKTVHKRLPNNGNIILP